MSSSGLPLSGAPPLPSMSSPIRICGCKRGRVANRLSAQGVAPGDRVAIYSENRRGFVLAYLALLRLGAIAVPTNVLYRAADLGNILEDAKPRIVVGSDQTRPHVPGGDAVRQRGRDRSLGCGRVAERRPDRGDGRARRRGDHHLYQRHHGPCQRRDDHARQSIGDRAPSSAKHGTGLPPTRF